VKKIGMVFVLFGFFSSIILSLYTDFKDRRKRKREEKGVTK